MKPILAAIFLLSATLSGADTLGTDSLVEAVSPQALSKPAIPDDDSIVRSRLATAQEAWDRGSPTRDAATGSPVSGSMLGSLLLQLFTSIALLAAIAFAGLFLYRKARGKNQRGAHGSLVDVLETTALPGGRQISLVRVHDRVVAVAFTASSASAVAEFTGDSAAEILAETGIGKNTVAEFASTLDTFMNRFRQNPNASRSRP
ncbi:MAG TPA: flagellar biosynthetic protein FliO [Fibrobacteria bacterium]|nr:flagellar biosynthetic protein FliO [Fibrobacteria bacterium]HOX52380.1 flagellar biosynthetic protein FliO [Fibrobacteria bacterium]